MKKKRVSILVAIACALIFLFLVLKGKGREFMLVTDFKKIDHEKLQLEETERYSRELENSVKDDELIFERNIFELEDKGFELENNDFEAEVYNPRGLPFLKGIVLGKKNVAFFSSGEDAVQGEEIFGYIVKKIYGDKVVLLDADKNEIILKLWEE